MGIPPHSIPTQHKEMISHLKKDNLSQQENDESNIVGQNTLLSNQHSAPQFATLHNNVSNNIENNHEITRSLSQQQSLNNFENNNNNNNLSMQHNERQAQSYGSQIPGPSHILDISNHQQNNVNVINHNPYLVSAH